MTTIVYFIDPLLICNITVWSVTSVMPLHAAYSYQAGAHSRGGWTLCQ